MKDLRERIGINFEFLKKPVDPNELLQLTYSQAHNWGRFRQLALQQQLIEHTSSRLDESTAELEQLKKAIDKHAIVSATDEKGIITYVNDQFCEVTGYRREELIGQDHNTVQSGDYSDHFYQMLWRTIRSGKVWRGELKNVKKGGEEYYWVKVTIVPFVGSSGVVTKYISIQTDITESKRFEEELKHANLSKDNFLASMSHELRTPLSAVIGNCQLMAERTDSPDMLEMIRSTEAAGRQQLSLVNDILDMAKIESGALDIEEKAYDLEAMLGELENIFKGDAEKAGLEFYVEQQQDQEYLMVGDAFRIEQILVRLVSNAIKFTEAGTISVRCWNDQEHLFVSVQDTGIGMAPEVQERIFQRFQQGDSSISRRFGGSGLGLYISFSLANMMGGYIDASSHEGGGSIFQLVLPYRPSDIPAERLNQRGTEHLFKGRVLVVDDTPEMQLVISRTLEDMGVTVFVAENGQQAVEQATRREFDLILMDMQMPVMDGIEATRILRDRGSNTPIVALTANVMQKYRNQFFEAGSNDFLSKPIDRGALRSVLNQYLEVDEETVEISENRIVIDEEMVALFIQRVEEIRQALAAAYEQEQWEEVRGHAHNIKGFGTTFGHPELTESGKEICDAYDIEHIELLPKLVRHLLEQLGGVLEGAAVNQQ